MRHHLQVVTEAAKRHIAIDAHEPVKDTGLRRTYPNWVSREGARGMEYNAWGDPMNPPEHETNLVFTRMLGGPMDFTPGVLSLKGAGGTPHPVDASPSSSRCTSCIYSPIQMAADLPENYGTPKPSSSSRTCRWTGTRRACSTAKWATTMFARKAKGSPEWFLGAVGDEQERRFDVALSFLKPGRRYEAQIYRDGDDADYRTNQRSMVIEKRIVTSADRLAERIAPGGGTAVRFVPIGR